MRVKRLEMTRPETELNAEIVAPTRSSSVIECMCLVSASIAGAAGVCMVRVLCFMSAGGQCRRRRRSSAQDLPLASCVSRFTAAAGLRRRFREIENVAAWCRCSL